MISFFSERDFLNFNIDKKYMQKRRDKTLIDNKTFVRFQINFDEFELFSRQRSYKLNIIQFVIFVSRNHKGMRAHQFIKIFTWLLLSASSSINCIKLRESAGVLAAVDGAVTIRRGVVSSNSGSRQALGDWLLGNVLPSLSRRLF